MTNPHYLRQEEHLRYLLQRFTQYLNQAKAPHSDRNVVIAFCADDTTFRVSESDLAILIDGFIKQQPRSSVGFIQNDKGEVLSVSRPHQPDNLGLPGGKIDPGETPEQAVVREVLEETGIEILDPTFCFERVDFDDGRVSWTFKATKWIGEPRKCEDGIEVQWVEPARLLTPSCSFRAYNEALFKALNVSWV